MKRLFKTFFVTIGLVMSLGIIFFIAPNHTIPSKADISSTSGQEIHLTGYYGFQPYHYFTDNENQSSLTNLEIISDEEFSFYLDEDGNKTNKFYVLQSKKRKEMSANAKFVLPADMLEYANAGILSVQFSAGFEFEQINSGEEINIQISSDGQGQMIVNQNGYFKSGFINVKDFVNVNIQSNKFRNKFKIFEPKLVFKVELSSLTFENLPQSVYVGNSFDAFAKNEISDFEIESDFNSYFQDIHKIEYVVTENAHLVSIIDEKIYVNNDITENTKIKIQARCVKNSLNGQEILQTEEKTISIIAGKREIKIISDFEDPANYTYKENAQIGDKIAIRVIPKKDFTFKHWIVNGEIITQSTFYYTVQEQNSIKAIFVKQISVESITVQDKFYDGNDNADFTVQFDGVEQGHDISLDLTAKFNESNIGNDRDINFSGSATLSGNDKDLYSLETLDQLIFKKTASIFKKEINLSAQNINQIYGDKEENLSFSVSEIVNLKGALSRESGSDVGEYNITVGNLIDQNPNYEISFTEGLYTISKREIYVDFDEFESEKEYDKSKEIDFSYNVQNAMLKDDISISLEIESAGQDVGLHNISILKYEILGDDKKNYSLRESSYLTDNYTVKILARTVKIKADDLQITYKESDKELTYSFVEGSLIDGDVFSGEISREKGNDAGIYKIQKGSLSNPNYNIVFEEASYEILKKDVTIIPVAKSKIYGEKDPLLEFSIEQNDILKEEFVGNIERVSGEKTGGYQIVVGSLANSNYNITIKEEKFEILKREVEVSYIFNDKVYDATNSVDFEVFIQNDVEKDGLTFAGNFAYQDCNVGENKKIVVTNESLIGENLDCYEIVFPTGEKKASIAKKEITLVFNQENFEKTYGDEDPEFSYELENTIENQTIIPTITRQEGEDCGKYLIDAEFKDNNYTFIQNDLTFLTINKATLKIKIPNLQSVFGDENLIEVEFEEGYSLKNGDLFEDAFSGQVTNFDAKYPGEYKIQQGTLKANENYEIISFKEGILNISKKDVQIVADSFEKLYGESDPVFTFTSNDIVQNEIPNLILSREMGHDIGDYQIFSSNNDDFRYNISFIPGELTISPREIELSIDEKIKIYGDEDPVFTLSVGNGFKLYNNDIFQNIQSGELQRVEGEDVGQFIISNKNFSLGKNYDLTFSTGILYINKAEIVLTANNQTKTYGDDDQELSFTFSSGELKFDDKVFGQLSRQEGEDIGLYQIQQGTLSLGENYDFEFVGGVFEILQKEVLVKGISTEKVYGESDPEFLYDLDEDFDDLKIVLFREYGKEFENAGKYKILIDVQNQNYNVEFVQSYLTILQKEIKITAHDKYVEFGSEKLDLTFDIEGELVGDDQVQGELYRLDIENAGVYEIRSRLTLGRNYKINYTKASYTIMPIKIVISSQDYEKKYGDLDPEFSFEVVQGEFVQGDNVDGYISRVEGENVGKYELKVDFNDTNYEVALDKVYSLTITPKPVDLKLQIHDKVFNGDNVAYIKAPRVNGLIDEDITLEYDSENCARFSSFNPQDDIPVQLFDITLKGEKAENYVLVYPENICGNITKNYVSEPSNLVEFETNDNTFFKQDVSVEIENCEVDESINMRNKDIVESFSVAFYDGENQIECDSVLKMSVEVNSKFSSRKSFYVYSKNENGEYKALNYELKDGKIVFYVDEISEILILSDNELWLDLLLYICISIVAIVGIYCTVYYIIKRKKQGKK